MNKGRAFLAGLALVVGACGTEDCSCGGGGLLFVELTEVVPGGSVELCVEDLCATGKITDVDGTADEATVPLNELGLYDPQLKSGTTVEVTVLDDGGAVVRSGPAVPESASNCCGVFWTVVL